MTRESRLFPFFFFAAVFCATFEKVQWNVAGAVFLADLTAFGFLLAFALDRLGRAEAAPLGAVKEPAPALPARAPASSRIPRTAAILIVFLAAFLLVYLIGFFNLETTQALDQFGKG